MKKTVALFGLALSGTGLAGLWSATALAADYFQDKRIVVVSSSAPGGGYDQYARLFARHFGDHIPGKPTVIVQNMPGAEGVKAANYIQSVAAQDGTFLGALPRTISLSKLYAVNSHGPQVDALKFQWLGSLKRDIGVLVVNAKSGLKRPEDLKGREVTVSSQAINSPNSIYARMLNQLYGSRLKPVEGYEGSTAGMLAVERGEVDGHITGGTPAPIKSKVQGWMQAGQGKVLVQFGLHGDPDFPDAPTVLDLLSDPASRKVFELAFTEQEIGSPIVLGPKVPKERVDILENAFIETCKDPDFLADAARENAKIYALDSKAVNDLLRKAYDTPPDLVRQLRELASPGHT